MENPDPSGISFAILATLLVFAAFFSAAEIAIVGLSHAKARSLVSQKRPGASAVMYCKHHPERILVTILMGSNIVNAAFPVLSTVLFAQYFQNEML